ncbi:hypothetical protein [Mesorhizobium sp. A556]
MAQTLIGRMRLLVEAKGLGEGKKVEGTLRSIETAAKRLGTAPWGANFQRQAEKMALSSKEFDQVRRSWNSLQRDMSTRSLASALRKSEVSNWKNSTLGHFAGIRADMKSTENRAREHARIMSRVLRPIGYAAGVGTLGYGIGIGGRAAFKAASDQTRTKYRMQLANIPPEEVEKMSGEASRLSTKYGSVDESDILELNKTAWAMMGGNGDRARALMEPLVKSFVMDVSAVDVEKAGENLNSFIKAMDNLNINEGPDGGVGNIEAILEGWTKAKQVEGKDVDIGEILGFARRAKVSKYALNDDFLTSVLPALGQDMGFSALGDALSGAYQNFVTPSSGGVQGQYVKRQKAAGLRDENNSLIERDLFAANPYEWALKVLKPQLEKNGTDTGNTAALSEAVKKLMSNSKAAAAITGWIQAQVQIDKNVALYKNAAGTKPAEEARQNDPFAAQESLLASLRNLSAAVLPMSTISAGLNSFADTINAFKDKIRAGDPKVMGAAGLGAAAAGFGAWKITTGIWGLITAGTNLNAAAVSLEAAAISLGGAGIPGGAAKKGGLGALIANPWVWTALAAAAGAAKVIRDTSASNAKDSKAPPPKYYSQGADQDRDNYRRLYGGIQFEGGMHRVGVGAAPAPGEPSAPMPRNSDGTLTLDTSGATSEAMRAGGEIKDALSIHATPTVDMSQVQQLEAAARRIRDTFLQIGSAAGKAGRAVVGAQDNLDAQMRRTYSDYGVVP